MSLIGVRELRQQASEVIRCVRKEGAEYVVTYQGRPVAIILPLDTARAEEEMAQASKNAISIPQMRAEPIAQGVREAASAYAVAQQPTIQDLETRIVLALQELAHQRGGTVGEVLSGLAEKALSFQALSVTRHGVPLFPTQPDASEVTLELVNQLRDETP